MICPMSALLYGMNHYVPLATIEAWAVAQGVPAFSSFCIGAVGEGGQNHLTVVKHNSHFVLVVGVDRSPSPSLVPFPLLIPFLCHIFAVVVSGRADISLRGGADAAFRNLRRGGVFQHIGR